jgi:hypothetical protein
LFASKEQALLARDDDGNALRFGSDVVKCAMGLHQEYREGQSQSKVELALNLYSKVQTPQYIRQTHNLSSLDLSQPKHDKHEAAEY